MRPRRHGARHGCMRKTWRGSRGDEGGRALRAAPGGGSGKHARNTGRAEQSGVRDDEETGDETDEQSLIGAANEGLKALQLFLASPLGLDAKEWRRRKKAAEERECQKKFGAVGQEK